MFLFFPFAYPAMVVFRCIIEGAGQTVLVGLGSWGQLKGVQGCIQTLQCLRSLLGGVQGASGRVKAWNVLCSFVLQRLR